MAVSLSIIVPAFNEAKRIGNTLKEVFEYLSWRIPESEVIVVDDGPSDETVSVVRKVFATAATRIDSHLICLKQNRGKGAAVRAGLLAARAPVALFSDADLSTPVAEVENIVTPITVNRCDVVLGSRGLDRTLIGRHQPWIREQSGRIFNMVMKQMTGLPYVDTQCGFKAMRANVCRPIAQGALIDRFGFDVELLFIAYKAGLRVLEQPVRWSDVEGSKVGLRAGIHAFDELRQLRRNDNKEIASELGISVRTVENHISHILAKKQFDNRVEIARYILALPR